MVDNVLIAHHGPSLMRPRPQQKVVVMLDLVVSSLEAYEIHAEIRCGAPSWFRS